MIIDQVVSTTRKMLIDEAKKIIAESQIHSLAFALRICGSKFIQEIGLEDILNGMIGDAVYGGYPEVAALGYKVAVTKNSELHVSFLEGLRRQKSRSSAALEALSLDDVALLGISEGLLTIRRANHGLDIDDLQQWLLELINHEPKRKIWTARLRDLAGDLLDGKGRLRSLPEWNDNNIASLEVVIREAWPEFQNNYEVLQQDFMEHLLSNLVKYTDPKMRQIEEIIVWVKALDLLIDQNSKYLFLKTDTAISLLQDIKKKIDAVSLRNTKISLIIWSLVIVFVNVLYFLIKEGLSVKYQDRLDFLVPLISILSGYIYQVLMQKELKPKAIFSLILEKNKLKLYKKWSFDIERYNKL